MERLGTLEMQWMEKPSNAAFPLKSDSFSVNRWRLKVKSRKGDRKRTHAKGFTHIFQLNFGPRLPKHAESASVHTHVFAKSWNVSCWSLVCWAAPMFKTHTTFLRLCLEKVKNGLVSSFAKHLNTKQSLIHSAGWEIQEIISNQCMHFHLCGGAKFSSKVWTKLSNL